MSDVNCTMSIKAVATMNTPSRRTFIVETHPEDDQKVHITGACGKKVCLGPEGRKSLTAALNAYSEMIGE